jgi:osmotically-inducible protein OsmY
MRDDELRTLVLDELAWDALIDDSQIDAQVAAGTVTLVGTVPTYAEKLAAQDAAGAVDGVHDLVNEIDVKPFADTHPSDDELSVMVEHVLSWDALVPEQDLTSTVADGWVTLSGTVTTASQRAEAERAVAHLEGVRGIRNDIEIVEPDLSPHDVRDAITGALARRAAHRVGHIDVVVDGTHVTLRGPIQTEGERTAILGAVGHAPGVTTVCDELRIDPGS